MYFSSYWAPYMIGDDAIERWNASAEIVNILSWLVAWKLWKIGWEGEKKLKLNSGKMAIPSVQKLSDFLLAPVTILDNKARSRKEQLCYLGNCPELIVIVK